MKKRSIIFLLMLIVFIIYTIIVKTIDVSVVGPSLASVGLSTINVFFRDMIGTNDFLYKATEIIGYVSLLVVGVYGIIGLIEVIKRKSILKVDKEIIALGIFYIIVLGIYVLFEKVIINYRPILIDGKLEASYPSSHTILSLFVCGSAILINKKLYNKKNITKIFNLVLVVIMLLTVIGRMLSGIHWFTDIIGGILISITLLYLFNTVINYSKLINKKSQ